MSETISVSAFVPCCTFTFYPTMYCMSRMPGINISASLEVFGTPGPNPAKRAPGRPYLGVGPSTCIFGFGLQVYLRLLYHIVFAALDQFCIFNCCPTLYVQPLPTVVSPLPRLLEHKTKTERLGNRPSRKQGQWWGSRNLAENLDRLAH